MGIKYESDVKYHHPKKIINQLQFATEYRKNSSCVY